MFVWCQTALQVAAAAQALQTLAAEARSHRGRWRKMSASTSSGSCFPVSAIAGARWGQQLPRLKRGGTSWAQEGQSVEGNA